MVEATDPVRMEETAAEIAAVIQREIGSTS
jgi:hypothetical protein